MMTLFNEEVKTTSTNSAHNTLYVESFEEAFFGVYTFELNGSALIAEEVAKYEGDPVVTIPVVTDGNKYEAPFILKKGVQRVEFNTANTVFVEKVIEEPDLNTVVETVKKEVGENNTVNITYNVDKDDIVKELKESLEADRASIIETLRAENSNTLEQVENIRDSIFMEFSTNSENYREKESKELKTYIENKLNEICHENNILIESSLHGDAKFASERDINKALSRVGSVKKELADSKAEIAKTIAIAEERIKKHYDVKIQQVEEAAVNNIRKNEILEVVKDSKAKILAELNNSHGLKKQLRHIAEEASNGQYDPVSSKRFQENLKRDIARSFTNEMQQIKRMVESYSGGGTNAVQYARGGVMNGNLNVEGTILSGGTDISSLFGSGGGGGGSNLEILDEGVTLTSTASAINFTGAGVTATNVGAVQTVNITGGGGGGGSDVSALSANWENTYTTVATSSGDWESTYTTVAANSADWAGVQALSAGDGIDDVGTATDPVIAVDSTVVRTSGDQTIGGEKTFTGNTTIQGNLSVQGDLTSIDTIVSVTSALSVSNHGTGPAIYAEQTGVSEPIAKFVDTEGGSIIFGDTGNVGIGIVGDVPGEKLTVSGNISADGQVRATSFYTLGYTNTSALDFNIDTASVTVSAGQLAWNPIDFTLDLGVNDNVTLQIGQEQLVHVKGGDNETIRNGMVVYAGGTVGGSDLIGVSAWSANSEFSSDHVFMLGLATEVLTGNIDGFVTTFGRVRGIDGDEHSAGGVREDGTPTWSVGEILYPAPSLSARGTLTNIKPISPDNALPVAWVSKVPALNNITLTVRANGAHGAAIDELHDVKLDSIQGNDLLAYNPVISAWENTADIVTQSVSAIGDVNGANIETLTNNVSALYSYLIQNFDSNQITIANDINDFVTSYPKTGLTTGDVVTISATNTAYILGDNDGSALSDWLEVNLKPNFLFYRQGLADYAVLDTLPLSGSNSTKYIIEVQDKSDSAVFYGEVNVVSDGNIAVASEYGLNHTTLFPFVEFGAEVVSGTHIQLSAVALEGKDMANFVFRGNRSNLFG
jgi:hypothetical protein